MTVSISVTLGLSQSWEVCDQFCINKTIISTTSRRNQNNYRSLGYPILSFLLPKWLSGERDGDPFELFIPEIVTTSDPLTSMMIVAKKKKTWLCIEDKN